MALKFERLIKFDLLGMLGKDHLSLNDFGKFMEVMFTIDSINQFINELPSFPDSTDKIIRNELISAIGATLAIEGTVIGEQEIEDSFQKASRDEKLQRREQEAENSRQVYYFILDVVSTLRNDDTGFVYSEQLIKQIHKLFTDHVDYIGNKPGDYRGDFAVTFGYPRRKSICKTRAEIDLAMSNFVKWLNKPKSGLVDKPISRAIMAHYYLTEIHPFADGNGRTARALEALILYVNGVNNYCFWSLANFWSRNKEAYLVYLGDIYHTLNPWDFIIWGMEGYCEEIRRIKGLVLKKVKSLMFIDYIKYLLAFKSKQQTKINQRIVDLLILLVRLGRISFDSFLLSPEVNALFHNVSSTTKFRDFKKMRELRLVSFHEVDGTIYIEPNFQILDRVTYRV